MVGWIEVVKTSRAGHARPSLRITSCTDRLYRCTLSWLQPEETCLDVLLYLVLGLYVVPGCHFVRLIFSERVCVFEDSQMPAYSVTTKHVDDSWPANTMPGARFRARNARTPPLQVNAGNLHALTGAHSACKMSYATGEQAETAIPWQNMQ